MGFYAMWINLIMKSVRIASYSISVNGEPKGLIQPSRGIKQVDPLTSFLLLYALKVYMGLLSKWQGMATSRASLCVKEVQN